MASKWFKVLVRIFHVSQHDTAAVFRVASEAEDNAEEFHPWIGTYLCRYAVSICRSSEYLS